MLSYRRRTPPTLILDPPVIAGIAAGLLVLSVLSFLLGRWSVGTPEPAAPVTVAAQEKEPPPPITVRRAPSGDDLSFLDRVDQEPAKPPPPAAPEESTPAASPPAVEPPRKETARTDPAPTPVKTPPPASPPPADAEGWIIQVFASESQARAEDLRRSLQAKGYPSRVVSVRMRPKNKVDEKIIYRVRVGPYASKSTASSVAERLKAEERLSTWMFKP